MEYMDEMRKSCWLSRKWVLLDIKPMIKCIIAPCFVWIDQKLAIRRKGKLYQDTPEVTSHLTPSVHVETIQLQCLIQIGTRGKHRIVKWLSRVPFHSVMMMEGLRMWDLSSKSEVFPVTYFPFKQKGSLESFHLITSYSSQPFRCDRNAIFHEKVINALAPKVMAFYPTTMARSWKNVTNCIF